MFAHVAGNYASRLISLWWTFRKAQAAVMVFPMPTTKRLCSVGRSKIGLVYTRVRQTELLSKFYRCLRFGYFSSECKRQDRSNDCWRCGEIGHFDRDCASTLEVQAAFRSKTGGMGTPDILGQQGPQTVLAEDAYSNHLD